MSVYGVEDVPDAPFQIINGVGQVPDADEVMGNDASIREWLRDNAMAALVPTGTILSYGGTDAPTGFLLCNGDLYTAAEQEELFNVIGYAFGGAGLSFNVPDLRGRMPVGVGLHSDVNTVGEHDSITDASERTPHHLHDMSHIHQHAHTHGVGGSTGPPIPSTTYRVPSASTGGYLVVGSTHHHDMGGGISTAYTGAANPEATDSDNRAGDTSLNAGGYLVVNAMIKS